MDRYSIVESSSKFKEQKMRTYGIDVQDGQGLITIAIKLNDYFRLRDYLRNCEVAFERRDEALEELAELKKMIKELP